MIVIKLKLIMASAFKKIAKHKLAEDSNVQPDAGVDPLLQDLHESDLESVRDSEMDV